jgi:hypothetical protein
MGALGDGFEYQVRPKAFRTVNGKTLEMMRAGGRVSGHAIGTAVDGVHAAVKDGHTQEALKRVLNNTRLDTPNYNRIDLLSDLGKADVDGIKLGEVAGMKKTLQRLGKRGSGAGFKFELQAAADLQKQGYSIEYVNELTPFAKGNYVPRPDSQFKPHYRTDIDVVAKKNGQTFNFQMKSSAGALNGGPDAESIAQATRSLNNWIGAAKLKDGIESVRIMVPPGVEPDPHITNVLRKYGLSWNAIKVESSAP